MLDALPDDARLWLFAILDGDGRVHSDLHAFVPGWQSHGRPVPAAAADVTPEGFPGEVLAVAAHLSDAEVNAGVSGCGIDAMQHAVEAAVARAGAHLAPALSVAYGDADGWKVVPRPAFRALVKSGGADGETPVLDLTAATLGALRADGLVRPAGASWHGRTFRLA